MECPDCGAEADDLHKCVHYEEHKKMQQEIDGLKYEVEVLNRRVKQLEHFEAGRWTK